MDSINIGDNRINRKKHKCVLGHQRLSQSHSSIIMEQTRLFVSCQI